ncbi:CCA tRNA nucleotidyltransferase [Staphylococcus sp. SQ8-PEA]|uniref:CCA-adding enzyme n=1 Tax=Staphylococcus marylandisciuri TaxID=2981529 RepID=A0ABT2QNE8_9STAP|nr:CCA tRNA nucleotidyltransferase [Staphylococcus marylandisciuri]MCU5745493.1 CCA tRNA nucleotidyltransferase [Staphylococcus marylandisciuri]
MTNIKFAEAKPILNHLEEEGYQAYFVGGAVRDYLMNRPIHDIDITTSATPEEIERIFNKTIPIGKEHGTINVVHQGNNYEITTFRAEAEYRDHRRPSEVYFVRNLYEDVKRRDFTINALAMNINYDIIDYFEGTKDIERHLIRTVGKPSERFGEDALRILRGLRFQAQLNFDIEKDTLDAMHDNMSSIKHLSIERIVVELKKLFTGINVSQAFSHLLKTNAFNYIPYFQEFQIDALSIRQPVDFISFLAILNCLQEEKTTLAKLKVSNVEKKQVQTMINMIQRLQDIDSKKSLRLYVYDFGIENLHRMIKLLPILEDNNIHIPSALIFNKAAINDIHSNLTILSRRDLSVSGKDLLEHTGKKGGAWIKDTLRQIEVGVVNHQVKNNKKDIIEWMETHVEI